MERKALVPIANGTEESEAVLIIDILRRAGINVRVAGENEIVTCSRGVKIIPDVLINDIDDDEWFDIVILPGGTQGVNNLLESFHLASILKRHKNNDKILAAICAAPTILADLKLIEPGATITSHPSVRGQLGKYIYSEEFFVVSDNGKLITSRGVGTTLDFALVIVELLMDEETADRVAMEIVYR